MIVRWWLVVIYGVMGMTALAYEILWMRMLSLMFGVSAFGVVFTVAAFMAGLGLGSFWGMRWAPFSHALKGLRALALIEAGLAIYSLLLPLLMPLLDQGLTSLGGGLTLAWWQALQGGSVILLLLPAATAMGLAFPMALLAARSLGVGVGTMYGVNALGGAAGALLPIWLLPTLGWRNGMWLVAALGLLLAGCAWWLGTRTASHSESGAGIGGERPVVDRPSAGDLFAYALIGAAALMFEILWARLFGTVLLRTEYVLAVLLFVYLVGIGFGGVIGRRMHDEHWFRVLPAMIAAAAIASLYVLPPLSRWVAQAEFSSFAGALLVQAMVVVASTLPVTVLLGAWLPMLSHRFFGPDPVGGGWWYAANSMGAALGALLAGFVLIPWLGSTAALIAAALLVFVCGMRWAGARTPWLAVPLLLLLAWPVRTFPPVASLLPSLKNVEDLSIYEDAVALTHVVERPDGQRLLLSDLQRMDASSDPLAVIVQKNQARLPLMLQPDARSVLFLGLGTGITAAGSLPFPQLKKRVGIELSQGAVIAARTYFDAVNGGIMRKMDVRIDDGRRYLRTASMHYDVIVGDLFHPDMAGRANLLSLQQFQRVRQRLSANGVFVQWLALNQFDVRSLKTVLATFLSAFGAESSTVFIDGYRMALVGFKGKAENAMAMMKHDRMLRSMAGGGEGVWTWLGRCWGGIPVAWLDQVPIQNEWAPVIEYTLPRVRYSEGVDMVGMWKWLLSWRAADEWVIRFWRVEGQQRDKLIRARAGTAMDVRMWMAELNGQETRAVAFARLARKANAEDRWPSLLLADRMFESLDFHRPTNMTRKQALLEILRVYPHHAPALRAMWQLALREGNADEAEQWFDRLAAVAPLAIDVREHIH